MYAGELQLASNMQAESDNDKHASHPKMKVSIIMIVMICYVVSVVCFVYYSYMMCMLL